MTASTVVTFPSPEPVLVYSVSKNAFPPSVRVTIAKRKFQFVDPATDVSYTFDVGVT
jgi:hypothetical protein